MLDLENEVRILWRIKKKDSFGYLPSKVVIVGRDTGDRLRLSIKCIYGMSLKQPPTASKPSPKNGRRQETDAS